MPTIQLQLHSTQLQLIYRALDLAVDAKQLPNVEDPHGEDTASTLLDMLAVILDNPGSPDTLNSLCDTYPVGWEFDPDSASPGETSRGHSER